MRKTPKKPDIYVAQPPSAVIDRRSIHFSHTRQPVHGDFHTGAAVVIAWHTIYFFVLTTILQFAPTFITLRVGVFLTLTAISFCTCLPASYLYRRTVDRSRHRDLQFPHAQQTLESP